MPKIAWKALKIEPVTVMLISISKNPVRRPILLVACLVGLSLCGVGFSYGQGTSEPEKSLPSDSSQQGGDGAESNPVNGPGAFVPAVVDAPGNLIGAGTRGVTGKRVALVIGNSQYESVAALDNPRNDAKAIAEALRQVGFDEVKLVEDLDYSGMRRALKAFATDALGADVALMYYAGHGVEVEGTNYLVPTDAALLKSHDIDFEAVPLDHLRTAVSGAGKLRIVILDACRNNPFKLASSDGKRSVGRGLARVESGANELIAYAARDGTLASDGTGQGNSPYAAALIKHLRTPGLEINFLFRKVRDDVLSATGHEQEPFVYGSLGGEAIYLNPPKDVGSDVANVSVDSSPAPQPNVEIVFWRSIQNSENPAAFKAYLTQYPEGDFAKLAEIRLAALNPDSIPATEEQTEEPTPELLRAVQTELSRLGCYSAGIDGDWGRRSQTALDEFARRTNQEAPLNSQLIELLKAHTDRVCPKPAAKPKTASRPKPKATTASRSTTQAPTTTATKKPATKSGATVVSRQKGFVYGTPKIGQGTARRCTRRSGGY